MRHLKKGRKFGRETGLRKALIRGLSHHLIVYKITEDQYRIVVNAGTREKDLEWMRSLILNERRLLGSYNIEKNNM